MARDERYADIMSAAEALLFVSDEPASSARLAEILEASPVDVDEALVLLAAEYMDDDRGIQLREVAGGWRFYTHPAQHDNIERYVISWDTHRMSQAALEALAVIAYHQPVTRATVNAIRGVNSESVVSSLVEKGLVREMGRDKPGGSILYGTTRTFLERFGLKSVKDLPSLEDFAPDDESREQIRERLSGTGKTVDVQLELTDDEDDDIVEDLLEEAAAQAGVALPDIVEPMQEQADDEDDDEDEPFEAVSSMRVVVGDVEEVDFGDDERYEDPEEMSEVIGVAMTEKVEFSFDEDEDIPTIE